MPETDETKPTQSQLSEIVGQLKEANNVLVTVSTNPSVDQLAACIGLTIALNRQEKHATAVFSGEVPSTIDFLEPEKTLEKDTNSLRDFIIALDKSKADKLRYKVEDSVVKIFITPYKTSISEDDLEFSQGDFNVDAVVAIGVHDRNELDAAIVAHGRILHDAVITSINVTEGADLGSIHWLEKDASSLSEMAADLVQELDQELFDSQIATAFLTGIVAETDRFRNEKASPHTMAIAGKLMAAGASTQLVSSKLEQPIETKVEHDDEQDQALDTLPEVVQNTEDDGVIQIDHDDDIHIDESGNLAKVSEVSQEGEENNPVAEKTQVSTEDQQSQVATEQSAQAPVGPALIYEPPTFGGQLTANTEKVDQQYLSNPDPLTTAPQSKKEPVLRHGQPEPIVPDGFSDQTLSDLEKSLNSPHVLDYQMTPLPPLPPSPQPAEEVPPAPSPDYARDAVNRAVQSATDYQPEPIQALGASPVDLNLNHDGNPPVEQNNSTTSPDPPPPPVPPPLPPVASN